MLFTEVLLMVSRPPPAFHNMRGRVINLKLLRRQAILFSLFLTSASALYAQTNTAYRTFFGGSGTDQITGIQADTNGYVYMCGFTASTDLPVTNAVQSSIGGGGLDGFVAKITPDGQSLVFCTYLGGSGADIAYGLTLDSEGNAVIVGNTSSPDFPTTNALQGSLGGGSGKDAFITKLSSDGSNMMISTYLGGTGQDEALSVSVDSTGSVVVCGTTSSANFPTVLALDTTLGGTEDGFVAKLVPNGSSLVFSTYLGGAADDRGQSIATDGEGNIFIAGVTDSTDFPVVNAYQGALGGGSGQDLFVTKFLPYGAGLVFSTYLGGSGLDEMGGIALDSTGSVVVCGTTSSTDFPTSSALDTTFGGGSDITITKLSSNGQSLVYSTYLGGSSLDQGLAAAVTPEGAVLFGGRSDSADFPTVYGIQQTNSGSTDVVFGSISRSGSELTFSSYLGGSNLDTCEAIAFNVEQRALVFGGHTDSVDFPVTNALQADLAGGSGSDGFFGNESADIDGDGLNDIDEMIIGTDLLVADTDGDGLSDAAEVNTHSTDPVDADSDDDGLNDGDELAGFLDPLDVDTDDDGFEDGHEILAGTDPLGHLSFLGVTAVVNTGSLVRIEWVTVFGKGYWLERATNLAAGPWTNIMGSPVFEVDESPFGTESLLDVNAPSNTAVFYRVRLD